MTGPILDSGGRPGLCRDIAVEIFWKNPELSFVSRTLFVLIIGTIPAGYILGRYSITPQDCVEQTQQVYFAIYEILIGYSVYAWAVERPKIWRAVRAQLASKRLWIRKQGWSYEIGAGTRQFRFGIYSVITAAIWIGVMTGWCFLDPLVIKACAGQFYGNPGIAPIMLGTTFALVVPHQIFMWGYIVLSAGRASA